MLIMAAVEIRVLHLTWRAILCFKDWLIFTTDWIAHDVKSSQVTIIYIALFTMQIVSKQLDSMKKQK